MSRTTRTVRPAVTARLAAVVALASAAVLGSAVAASAHVHVDPATTVAGSYSVLTVRVPNESATASTTQVVVDLPTDVPFTYVATEPVPGWTATVEEGDLPAPVEVAGATITQAPLRVVWTADPGEGAGIADGEFQRFAMSAGPLPEAGTDVVLPAHQTYSDGSVVDWDQVAAGDEEPEYPAPVFTTTEPADATAEPAADTEAATAEVPADATPAAEAPSNALPISLGAAALVAALAALVVALRSRRTR